MNSRSWGFKAIINGLKKRANFKKCYARRSILLKKKTRLYAIGRGNGVQLSRVGMLYQGQRTLLLDQKIGSTVPLRSINFVKAHNALHKPRRSRSLDESGLCSCHGARLMF